ACGHFRTICAFRECHEKPRGSGFPLPQRFPGHWKGPMTVTPAADLVYWGESHPEGWLLAHNNIKHGVRTRHGERGFRAFWLDPKTHSHWVICDCGWRPDLGTHYRRPEARNRP